MDSICVLLVCLAIYFGLNDAAKVLAKAYAENPAQTVCEARHE